MVADSSSLDSKNRRTDPRFEDRSRVTVTVLSAPDAPLVESHHYFCWMRDLSVTGMRFCVHSRVPVDAILKLEVTFEDPREQFLHIGIVMWEKEFVDEGIVSNWIGVKITETDGGTARFNVWKDCVEKNVCWRTADLDRFYRRFLACQIGTGS